MIDADRSMLLQVLYNLINNAINYIGEDKLVIVEQTVRGKDIRISVTDHGEGIAPDQLPYIWDRYYKVDKVHRRATVGTGIGLSIVKGVLESHNAIYGVDSTLGVGSTFWFEIPMSEIQNPIIQEEQNNG
jgi:signal transduction histidine kinase